MAGRESGSRNEHSDGRDHGERRQDAHRRCTQTMHPTPPARAGARTPDTGRPIRVRRRGHARSPRTAQSRASVELSATRDFVMAASRHIAARAALAVAALLASPAGAVAQGPDTDPSVRPRTGGPHTTYVLQLTAR